MNRLKKVCCADWFTTSQEKSFEKLRIWLLRPGLSFVYLYGPHGTGKTYLGWILEKEGIVKYFPDFASCKDYVSPYIPAFVDNIDTKETGFRRTMRSLEILGVRKAVLVGIYVTEEDVPKVQLTLDADSLNQVCEILVKNGFNVSTKFNSARNLWELLAL